MTNCKCDFTVRFNTRCADVVLMCMECFGVGGKSGNVVHNFNCTQKGCSHDDWYYKSRQQLGYINVPYIYARQQVAKDLLAATNTLVTMRAILEGLAPTVGNAPAVAGNAPTIVDEFYRRNEQQKIHSVILDMTNLHLTIPW